MSPQDQTKSEPPSEGKASSMGLAALGFGPLGAQSVDAHHTLREQAVDALVFDLADPEARDFGDYELLDLIGRGGMGVVYRARQKSLDREVAVKLMIDGLWAGDDEVGRFEREAKAAARLQHPNIVDVYDTGTVAGLRFISMRLVRGGNLAQKLKSGFRFQEGEAARFVRVLASAVDYAHRMGILHLDLKPSNVLLEDGMPLLADFGLVRQIDSDESTDHLAGTPNYMAPEQALARAEDFGPATDVYGLGAILYELLSGKPPFTGASAKDVLRLVVEQPVEKPIPEHLLPWKKSLLRERPDGLTAICLMCLKKCHLDRYQSAELLADDLRRFLDFQPVSAYPSDRVTRFAMWIVRWMNRDPARPIFAALLFLSLVVGKLVDTYYAAKNRELLEFAARNAAVVADSKGSSDIRRNLEDWAGTQTARSPSQAQASSIEFASRLRAAGNAKLADYLERRQVLENGFDASTLIDHLLTTGAALPKELISKRPGLVAIAYTYLAKENLVDHAFLEDQKGRPPIDAVALSATKIAKIASDEVLRGGSSGPQAQLAAIGLSRHFCGEDGEQRYSDDLAKADRGNGTILLYATNICHPSVSTLSRYTKLMWRDLEPKEITTDSPNLTGRSYWYDHTPTLYFETLSELQSAASALPSWRREQLPDSIDDDFLLRVVALHYAYWSLPLVKMKPWIDYCTGVMQTNLADPKREAASDEVFECFVASHGILIAPKAPQITRMAAATILNRVAYAVNPAKAEFARQFWNEQKWQWSNVDAIIDALAFSPEQIDIYFQDMRREGEAVALLRLLSTQGISATPSEAWNAEYADELLSPSDGDPIAEQPPQPDSEP